MFVCCFFFAKQIYNVLVWPFVLVAGPENSKFIYTALLEYFITQLKLAMFGAAFLSFPVVATQIYMADHSSWLSSRRVNRGLNRRL